MNTINLSKEAKSLVVECDIRPGIAAVWHDSLKLHFDTYGAQRMMTEKNTFDKSYLDMFIGKILKHYNGKITDVEKELNKVWNKSNTNYDYFLKSIFFISNAVDFIEENS